MIEYNDYISKLKGRTEPIDYGMMFEAIEQKIAKQKAAQNKVVFRGALAGALSIFIVGLAFYLSYPAMRGGNDQMLSYIYGQPEITDGPVIDYVFSD